MNQIPRTLSLFGGGIVIFSLLSLGFRDSPGAGSDSPLPSDDPYLQARIKMVERDLKARDITNPRVLEVMSRAPRHLFIEPGLRKKAYADHPLPIGEGQTISQPYIVALMTQLLNPRPEDVILEIGTGSGYQAAVLAELVDRVYSVEIRPPLCRKARERLAELGYKNVEVKCADGYLGWEEHAPFDAVIVTAAADHVPPPLLQQLKTGGALIIPLGSTTYYQTLTLVRKKAGGKFEFEEKSGVVFVPLIGSGRKKSP